MSDQAAAGLRALRQLSSYLAAGSAAQFVHSYERFGEGDRVRHVAEGCPLCDWLAVIEDALIADLRVPAVSSSPRPGEK